MLWTYLWKNIFFPNLFLYFPTNIGFSKKERKVNKNIFVKMQVMGKKDNEMEINL